MLGESDVGDCFKGTMICSKRIGVVRGRKELKKLIRVVIRLSDYKPGHIFMRPWFFAMLVRFQKGGPEVIFYTLSSNAFQLDYLQVH